MLIFIEVLIVIYVLRLIYLATFTNKGLIQLTKTQGITLLVVGFLVLPAPLKALLLVVAVIYVVVKTNRKIIDKIFKIKEEQT